MCGKPIHRVELEEESPTGKICYMDYFCDIGFCDHHKDTDGWCTCPLDEDEEWLGQ